MVGHFTQKYNTDLTDDCMPNTRYSSDELKKILENQKFSEISIVNVRVIVCRLLNKIKKFYLFCLFNYKY